MASKTVKDSNDTHVKHTHVLEDGTVITHSHGHTHTNTKAVLNRLSKAIGHLESIKKMVEDGRDCSEVLTQLAAVKSAINNTGKHLTNKCLKFDFYNLKNEEIRSCISSLSQILISRSANFCS